MLSIFSASADFHPLSNRYRYVDASVVVEGSCAEFGLGPASADPSLLILNWIQHVKARRTESVSGERIRFSERTCQARSAANSGRNTSCSSLFRSTHPGTSVTGGVSQRRTERLIAGDVFDSFVEPICQIESACCALQSWPVIGHVLDADLKIAPFSPAWRGSRPGSAADP
jgi:hypothetical protein